MRAARAVCFALALGMFVSAVAKSRSHGAEIKRPPALAGEQAAVDLVVKLEGSGLVNDEGHVFFIDFRGKPVTDEELVALRGLKHLEELDLSSTAISDRALEFIATFPKLARLNLSRTEITDNGIAKLDVMKQLELDLSHTGTANPTCTKRPVTAQPAAMISVVLAEGVPIETKTPVGRPPKFDPFKAIPLDTRGWTALHLAANLGKVAAVKALLEHGADVHAKTTVGWTPLECVDVFDEYAARYRDDDDDKAHRQEIRKLLKAKMAKQ